MLCPYRKGEKMMSRGLGLVELMVGSSILLVGILSGSLLIQKILETDQNLTRLSEIDVIRRVLRTQFSCKQSLGIDPEETLPQQAKLASSNKSIPILGRDGVELFPIHTSGQYYVVGDWHIKSALATDRIVFQGRLSSPQNKSLKADPTFGQWRDIFSGTSIFCRQYLNEKILGCNESPYTQKYGMDSRGAQCCRVTSKSGSGHAVAQCSSMEIMVQGGGLCAGGIEDPSVAGEDRTREVVKTKQMGPALGSTAPTVSFIALPGIPHFFFPAGSIISNILKPFENTLVKRGGFLVKSLPDSSPDGTLSKWEAACKTDDSLDDYKTTAYAVCCPKRW